MKKLLLTCFAVIISVIFVLNFNFVSIKDSNYKTEQNKNIVFVSQKEEEKKEENKKEENKKEEEEKKEENKNKAIVFIKRHKLKAPDFCIHYKVVEKGLNYIDCKKEKEEEKRSKEQDQRIKVFLTEKRKEDFKKMRHDLVYIHDVHVKHRKDTIEDNRPLHKNLIRKNRISWEKLQAKKNKNQNFLTEERLFQKANENLNNFERNQNEFLDKQHNILNYPHTLLGEEFNKQYKTIYNPNETDPKKKYKFKVKNLKKEYDDAKKFLNEEDSKEKTKKKQKTKLDSAFHKACAAALTLMFPVSYFVIKRVVFPLIPS